MKKITNQKSWNRNEFQYTSPKSRPISSNLSTSTIKKIEGCDKKISSISSPKNTLNNDKSLYKSSFRASVEQLKNKNKSKNIQQQYVSGLQEQIKFLEYELKLLKDKQVSKKNSLDELQKFFDDGISINENILGIKNIFKNQKNELQARSKKIQNECKQKQQFITSIQKQIQKHKDDINKIEKNQYQRQSNYIKQIDQIHKDYFQYCERARLIEQQNKQKLIRNKKINEQSITFRRNKEIENIFIRQQSKNNNSHPLATLKNTLVTKDSQILLLELQKIRLQRKLTENIFSKELQDQNLKLKKKILTVGKQINLVNTKIQENNFILEQKIKQRETEFMNKTEIAHRIFKIKQKIDRQNLVNEEVIDKKIKEKQQQEIKEIEKKNMNLKKYIIYYKNEADLLQQRIHQILHQKPQIQHMIQQIKNQIETLHNKVNIETKKDIQFSSTYAILGIKLNDLQSEVEPINRQNTKFQQKISTLLHTIQLQKKQIMIKQKQLELLKELKSFNLQEVKMIKNTGSHIQDNIISFLKKWDSINKQNIDI